MSTNITLAIAPGKRHLGVAVFSGADLIYVGIKSIRSQESKERLLEDVAGILKKLFQEFSIGFVAIKAVSQYQKLSLTLDEIVERINRESRQHGLETAEITLEQIKSALCKTGKPTQGKAFETLLAFYPELARYWDRPNKWQNDYYALLFSAVAVGVVCLNIFDEAE